MIRNPELRRNLWLEFTANRVVIGVTLVLIVFATAAAADFSLARMAWPRLDFAITAAVARWGFFAIVLLWGGRQAAGAVIQEIRDRTWDGQRLSAVGPWTMCLGKLFGATAYTWAIGFACLAVYLAVAVYNGTPGSGFMTALSMVGFGLLCHTIGLLLSLTRLSRTPGFRPANVTLIHLIALGATIALHYATWMPERFGVDWWGLRLDRDHFSALTAWAFALWGVVGINRRMRRELQFTNAPLVWPLFLAFTAAWLNGIARDIGLPGAHIALTFLTAALFVYLLILFEPKEPLAVRRIGALARAGRTRAALSLIPLWALSFAALVLVTLAGGAIILGGTLDRVSLYVDGSVERFLIVQLVATFLFVLRDVLIVLAFNLSRENRDGTAVAFVVLVVLWAPLPLLLLTGKLTGALTVFWPMGGEPWLMAVGPVALQVFVVAAILIWRWRAYWRSSPAVQGA